MIENGYQADHAIYSAADGNASLHRSWIFKQRKRVVPWELSCLAIFVFSIILLVSAWLDFRDDKSWPAEDDRENFGEKGEIYL